MVRRAGERARTQIILPSLPAFLALARYPPRCSNHPFSLAQVGMSGMLNQFGLVKFLSDSVAASLAAMHLSWPYVVRSRERRARQDA